MGAAVSEAGAAHVVREAPLFRVAAALSYSCGAARRPHSRVHVHTVAPDGAPLPCIATVRVVVRLAATFFATYAHFCSHSDQENLIRFFHCILLATASRVFMES